MNNTRFATAIHILTLLAGDEKEEWMNSDFIAGSLNVNPVVVRRELSVLNEAGLVMSRKGKEGGVRLSKSAKNILLSEIYAAVRNAAVLGKKNQNPNPLCPIGKTINTHLDTLYQETNLVVLSYLGNKSLADFVSRF